MSSRSALTAALSGQPNDPNTAPQAAKKDDPFSFPCLSPKAGEDDLSANMERLSLAEARSLAGSAAIPVTLPNGSLAADYELNPHRRRGGEERVPSGQSLGQSLRGQSLLSQGSLQSNFVSDATIGSLPRGLSGQERKKLFQSVPLSPTLNLLSSLPSDKVSSRSLDGRKLRRHVLRGAVIVFVTAGYSGKRFIFEKAKELGVRSVILDGPDSWSQTLQTEGIIEKFIPIDFSDADAVFDHCLTAIKKAKAEFGELDGVCTYCEMAVPLATRLAEKLGLPGNTPAAVDAARDKHATRQVLQKAGLPSPRNSLIEDPKDVRPAAKHVGFPSVIKPIHGAASLGVVRVNNVEDLEKTYVRVVEEMSSAKIVDGAIVQGNASQDGNMGDWIKPTLMLEEYLDGPEVDVDLVFSEGQPVYGSITDNWPTVEPYFNETGSNSPSILPSIQQKELIDLAVKSTQALGFTQGVFHVELKYTSRGARLIEVNCRMGGGAVRNLNLLTWGVDLVEEHLLTSAGIPSRPPVASKPLMNIAEYTSNSRKTGTVQSDNFCKEFEKSSDVLYCRPLVKKGDKVTSVIDGMPTWVAELMVTKPTLEEAIEFAKEIEAKLTEKLIIS